jgi:3-methyladenine DNA glycosylase AlkD
LSNRLAVNDASREAAAIIIELRSLRSVSGRAGMARFGISTKTALGVSMTVMRPMTRPHRRRHDLAAELWASGIHEARIFAALIEDPRLVTPAQMDSWAADFASWDVCDQVSMRVFARTPYIASKVAKWAKDEREFVRRAAFATIAGYAVHAKQASDDAFAPFLVLIERYATDRRNFVKKAVNWALRQIGKRSPAQHEAALALAGKLAASEDPTARWIGKDAVRELSDPRQVARINQRSGSAAPQDRKKR